MDHSSIIQAITGSLDALDRFARNLIGERLLNDYIQTLNNNDTTDVLRACVRVDGDDHYSMSMPFSQL